MAKREWASRSGRCVMCGKRGRVVFHHIIRERDCRNAGGDPWDFRNALALGNPFLCQCHARHHHVGVNDRRIPLSKIPAAAIEFAEETLGPDRAALYLARYYHQGGST